MMSENFLECRTLPAINETFPQFNRPISLLSPLDLSLRASNSIPITPPSTPSPPRKRHRLMSDENFLWRPHVMETAAAVEGGAHEATDLVRISNETSNYLNNLTYSSMEELGMSKNNNNNNNNNNTNNNSLECNNLSEIPESRVKELPQQQQQQQQQQQLIDLDTIYVDDETILLTEDEDETLVSSHDYTEDAEEDVDDDDIDDAVTEVEAHDSDHEKDDNDEHHEEDEDEYVDVLGNDDDDDVDVSHTTMLQLQSETENYLENSGKVLTRNKLIYEDEELHNQAVDGLAKLFDRDFQCTSQNDDKTERTYVDLTTGLSIRENEGNKKVENPQQHFFKTQQQTPSILPARSCNHPKTYKTGERKRMKLRKNLSILDEDTISPVSGTIIRKLRDDEELVVRKGDIDPAFNVVEITEEAKAILASIDNKIGAYLCRLCHTLYDDAFQLAQHRCPRIVHIEYKCSECDKVFNCPANLASHRRWHKPKSELLAKGQVKKRQSVEPTVTSSNLSHEKLEKNDLPNESADGNFPCPQCGKNFRRHAYLKKHQASHQMMENLKSLDIFKNCSSIGNYRNEVSYQPNVFRTNLSTSISSHGPTQQAMGSAQQANLPPHGTFFQQQQQQHTKNSNHSTAKLYPQRFGALPFPPFHDQRRFYSLEDFYLSQHFERSSAFQYVQATTHLRNLSTTNSTSASTIGSSFLSRAAAIPSLNSLTVK